MRESCIIAGHYFKRMARKPLLILFMLAIPFTLMVAEFEAFGRPQPHQAGVQIPLRLALGSPTPTSNKFVQCLAELPEKVISVQQTGDSDLVTSSGSSPLELTLHTSETNKTDALLEYSALRVCAYESSGIVSQNDSVLVRLRSGGEQTVTPSGNVFFARFFPGLALFGCLFLVQSMASLVWRDYELAVQKRLLTSPVRSSSLVAGPLIFLTTGATASLLFILTVCALKTNPSAIYAPAFLAFALGFGFCAAGMQLAIGLMAGSQRAAQAMSSSANMMLSFFGGGFVPLSIYPPALRSVAFALPNGAAQAGFTQILDRSATSAHLSGHLITVWIWAAVLTCSAILLQSRRMHT